MRRRAVCMMVLLALLALGGSGLGGCNLDGRYHRCQQGDDCGRDDLGRVLYCACDGICRAKCKANPADNSEKCRAAERCVSDFCIHQDEKDTKLGVSCELEGGVGNCAFGVNSCNRDGDKVVCRATSKVGVEVCDGEDNDCNGKVDDDLTRRCNNVCGGGFERCVNGKWTACDAIKSRVCRSSNDSCENGIEQCKEGKWTGICAGEVKPTKEECNGKDDDCDGVIDEGTSETCSNACGAGTRQCVAGVLASCNATSVRPCGSNIGACEAGVQLCKSGQWGMCEGAKGPTTEVCDGKDNDCDGEVDETWPTVGEACEAGLGECRSIGVVRCDANKQGVLCQAKAKSPTPEVCDGKDNDCDGTIDDGLEKACYNDCGRGVERCVNGSWEICNATRARICGPAVVAPCSQGVEFCQQGRWTGICVGQIKGYLELCDGKDNDCDGRVDEEWPTLGSSCRAPGVGECGAPGKFVCSPNRGGVVCDARSIPPAVEVCDGKDNDCDGLVDNLKPIVLSNHSGTISDVAYSPDGRQLLSASIDGKVLLWDRSNLSNPPTLSRTLNLGSPVYAAAYHPQGTIIATGAADKNIKLWNPATGQLIRTLTGHTDIVTRVGFGRFGQLLFSASADNTLKVWQVSTGKLLQTLSGHQGPVYGAAMGSYSRILASGGNDKKGLIWNLGRGNATPFWTVNASIGALAFDRSGLELFVGASDNAVRRYLVIDVDIVGLRYQQANLIQTYNYHKAPILRIATHPTTGIYWMSGSADREIAVWNTRQGVPLFVLKGHTNSVRAVAFHPGHNEVVSGADDQKVHIWTCLNLPQ